jgi:hypothetical protein
VHPRIGIDPASGLPVDSALFRQRAPHILLSDDPDTATIQTVREMCRQVREAAKDPPVRAIARRAVEQFRGGPAWIGSGFGTCERMMADSCWWWCKHYLEFRHHGEMFEAWSADLGDPRTKLQLLIAPDVLVRMQRMEGDCAIYTMMLCAMLEALGLSWRICPAAVDHSQPEIFSHVFARVVLPNGATESLDASHGKYPGWQVPAEDLLRLWVFDENGNRVADSGRQFQGLHDYRRRTSYPRGLGANGDDYLEGGDYFPPSDSNPTERFGTDLRWPPSDGYTAPSQNSSQWAAFASNLAKMGFTLAQINSITPGTVVGPNGQILRQNPGYSVPVGTSASLNLGSSSNVLIYGGLALVGVFVMAQMFKGGR